MMVSLNWVAPQQLSTVLAFSLRGTAKNLVLKVYRPPLTLGKEEKVDLIGKPMGRTCSEVIMK